MTTKNHETDSRCKKFSWINPKTGLNVRQERFAREYVIDFNGTRAAKAAGYSAKTACEIASQLLSNFKVKKFIDELKKPIDDALDISKERILQELASLAFSNISNYITFNENGDPIIKLKDVPAKHMAALKSIEATDIKVNGENVGVKTKIQTIDKFPALRALAEREGLLNPVPGGVSATNMTVNGDFVVSQDPDAIARKIAFILAGAAKGK